MGQREKKAFAGGGNVDIGRDGGACWSGGSVNEPGSMGMPGVEEERASEGIGGWGLEREAWALPASGDEADVGSSGHAHTQAAGRLGLRLTAARERLVVADIMDEPGEQERLRTVRRWRRWRRIHGRREERGEKGRGKEAGTDSEQIGGVKAWAATAGELGGRQAQYLGWERRDAEPRAVAGGGVLERMKKFVASQGEQTLRERARLMKSVKARWDERKSART